MLRTTYLHQSHRMRLSDPHSSPLTHLRQIHSYVEGNIPLHVRLFLSTLSLINLQFMEWERSFEERVMKIRRRELKYQKLNYRIEARSPLSQPFFSPCLLSVGLSQPIAEHLTTSLCRLYFPLFGTPSCRLFLPRLTWHFTGVFLALLSLASADLDSLHRFHLSKLSLICPLIHRLI